MGRELDSSWRLLGLWLWTSKARNETGEQESVIRPRTRIINLPVRLCVCAEGDGMMRKWRISRWEDKHTKDALEILVQAWEKHGLQTISLKRMWNKWIFLLPITIGRIDSGIICYEARLAIQPQVFTASPYTCSWLISTTKMSELKKVWEGCPSTLLLWTATQRRNTLAH